MTSTPTDLGERHRIVVHGHGFGEVRHPDGNFHVDDDFIGALKQGFRQLTSQGYYPPVLRQHKPDEEGAEPRPVEDGFTYGRTLEVIDSRESRAQQLRTDPMVEAPDKGGVWFLLEVPEPVKAAHDAGFIDNWSPSFYEQWTPPHPEMGDVIELAPRHMSFVSVSHQKNLDQSSPYYSLDETDYVETHGYELAEGLIDTTTQEPDMADDTKEEQTDGTPDDGGEPTSAPTQLEEVVDPITEAATSLAETAERFEAMLSDDDEGDDAKDNEEQTVSKGKYDELTDRVRDLEEQNDELKRERRKQDIVQRGVDDETADDLVELAEEDPEAFALQLADAVAEANKGEGSTTSLREKGSTGNPPKNKTPDEKREEIFRELEEEGYERPSSEFFKEASKRGVNFTQ